MFQLAQHIEILLLDNDCVIVPRLGGFVAHYSPAQLAEEESMYYPPSRSIGFNPRLKINDGVLAESYMNHYGISYTEANKRIDHDVDDLLSLLHEDGKVELNNIGILLYNIKGIYEFKPFDNKLTSPSLYGLDAIPVKELSTISSITTKTEDKKKDIIPVYDEDEDNHSAYTIHLNRTLVRTVAAVAAVILLTFVFSTPIKNVEFSKDNQAQLIPEELINKVKSESLLTNLIGEEKPSSACEKTTSPSPIHKAITNDKQAEKPKQRVDVIKDSPYKLIVASSISKKRADEFVKELKGEGFDDAEVLTSGKMVRVSIASADTENKAYTLMNKLVKTTDYSGIWVMKQKPSSSDNN